MNGALKGIVLATATVAMGLALSAGRASKLPVLAIRTPVASQSPPDAGPDIAVEWFLTGLRDARLEVIWEALPASYQRDVNKLLREFVQRVPAEIWDAFFQVVRKCRTLAASMQSRLEKLPAAPAADDSLAKSAGLSLVAEVIQETLDSLLASDLPDQQRVASADVERLWNQIAPRLTSPLMRALEKYEGLEAFDRLWRLRDARVELRSMEGDLATVMLHGKLSDGDPVSLDLVRVDGKWIPRSLATTWPDWIERLQSAARGMEWKDEQRHEARVTLFHVEQMVNVWTATIEADFIDVPTELLNGELLAFPSNSLMLLGYLLSGPPMIQPDAAKVTGESLTEDSGTVLVMCYAPMEVRWDNDRVDRDVARQVALRLVEHQVRVVDPDRVQLWLDRNKEWQDAAEVGAALKADLVVHIELKDYSLFEEHTADLYRGRATAIVSLIRSGAGSPSQGEVLYKKDVVVRHPFGQAVPAETTPYADFSRDYLARLSQEIGRLFYETAPE